MNRRITRIQRFTRAALVSFASLLVVSAGNPTVELSHHQVSPTELTIQKGEAVTFVNRVNMSGGHRVVADDDSFSSPALEKGESWTHTFEQTGAFHYHLDQHPGTRGVIHVE